jgi:hypothetical protein
MSKHRQETTVEAPAPAPIPGVPSSAPEIPPAPAPLRLPIGQCLGKMIFCPTCNAKTEVTHARGARTATQVVSSIWWVKAICSGFCGAVLRRTAEVVTVMPDSVPKPVVKSLGAAVGKRVLCPNELRLPDGDTRPCGREARATWDQEQAHAVVCPDCGVIPYPGATLVELVG